jgi:hypothetical protein
MGPVPLSRLWRADLDLYAARIIQRAGEPESRLLLEAAFDPERNETRVLVDPGSTHWPRRLGWLRGWRRLPE